MLRKLMSVQCTPLEGGGGGVVKMLRKLMSVQCPPLE